MHRQKRKSPPKRKKLSPDRPLQQHAALMLPEIAESILVQLPLGVLLNLEATEAPEGDTTARALRYDGFWRDWVEQNIEPRHDREIIMRIPTPTRWRYYARLHGRPAATEIYTSTCCGGNPRYSRFYAAFSSPRPISMLRTLAGWPNIAVTLIQGELGWFCELSAGVFSAGLLIRKEHQSNRKYVDMAELASRRQNGFDITLFLLDNTGTVSQLTFFAPDVRLMSTQHLTDFWNTYLVMPKRSEQFGTHKVVQLTAKHFITNTGALFAHHAGRAPERVDAATYLCLFRTETESSVADVLLGTRLEDMAANVPLLIAATRMIPSVSLTQRLPTLMVFDAPGSNMRVSNIGSATLRRSNTALQTESEVTYTWREGQSFTPQKAAGLAPLHDRGGAFWDTRGRLFTWAAVGELAGNGSHVRRAILPDLSLPPLLSRGIPDFVVACENDLDSTHGFVALAVTQPRSRTIITMLSEMKESDLRLLVAAFLLPLHGPAGVPLGGPASMPLGSVSVLFREALLRESPTVVLELGKERIKLRKYVEELQKRTMLQLLRDTGKLLGQLRDLEPVEAQAALWEYVQTSGLAELYKTQFDVNDLRYALATLMVLSDPWVQGRA